MKPVPDIVVARLPLYLRALAEMRQQNKRYTSSQEMGTWLGISSAQIRKDLSHFGEFGKQGTGYSVTELMDRLRGILHIEREWPIVIVGAGNIGSAVASYSGFNQRGFQVSAVFDADPLKVGSEVGAHTVRHASGLGDYIRAHGIRVAMISVPAAHAQAVADRLTAAGITAILNYAPVSLTVPAGVRVSNFDPVLQLQHMMYYS